MSSQDCPAVVVQVAAVLTRVSGLAPIVGIALAESLAAEGLLRPDAESTDAETEAEEQRSAVDVSDATAATARTGQPQSPGWPSPKQVAAAKVAVKMAKKLGREPEPWLVEVAAHAGHEGGPGVKRGAPVQDTTITASSEDPAGIDTRGAAEVVLEALGRMSPPDRVRVDCVVATILSALPNAQWSVRPEPTVWLDAEDPQFVVPRP